MLFDKVDGRYDKLWGKLWAKTSFFVQIGMNVWKELCFVGGIDLTPSISVLTRGRGAHQADQQVIRGLRRYLLMPLFCRCC